MHETTTAGCVAAYDAPEIQIEPKANKILVLVKRVPWVRIVVDALLVAAILLVSSNFLSVR